MDTSATRSHLLATINSPNLRRRAVINNDYSTRPLSPPMSASSSSVASSSFSLPSSPATRKSSTSVLGRFKTKVKSIDAPDNSAYTPLLPVTASSVPSSPGSSKRQGQIDALPRTLTSTRTSIPTASLRNSTSGDSVTRPSMSAEAASVQRRRLPSPPCDDVDTDWQHNITTATTSAHETSGRFQGSYRSLSR